MKTIIVLAMHGSPPNDFPKNTLMEYFGLHARLEFMPGPGPGREAMASRYRELDAKLRTWPRTGQNDPFYAASMELAKHLQGAMGNDVIVGFNEFCNPSLDDALNEAISKGAEKLIVVTPMMTPGGGHSEVEIPAAIKRAQEQHPGVEIHYAWPFNLADVSEFLAAQIDKSLS